MAKKELALDNVSSFLGEMEDEIKQLEKKSKVSENLVVAGKSLKDVRTAGELIILMGYARECDRLHNEIVKDKGYTGIKKYNINGKGIVEIEEIIDQYIKKILSDGKLQKAKETYATLKQFETEEDKRKRAFQEVKKTLTSEID